MDFLVEFKSFYKEGDIVLIQYWYNDMIVPVKIIEKNKRNYKVTHNITHSQIPNAPDETIKVRDIIENFY